uniref:Pancreatic trypsin inhibitor n=1 Tax=Rhipicephalus appendiculatus TaxID=34631 RepID=A0A131YG80_RHIAP
MARLIFLVVLCLLLVSATCSPAWKSQKGPLKLERPRRTVLRSSSPWQTKVIQPQSRILELPDKTGGNSLVSNNKVSPLCRPHCHG